MTSAIAARAIRRPLCVVAYRIVDQWQSKPSKPYSARWRGAVLLKPKETTMFDFIEVPSPQNADPNRKPMRAFQVSDCEWWAAVDESACRADYKDTTGEDVDDDAFRELTDAELDKEIPETDEDERPTGNMTTMRAFLDEMTGPGFLAGTDY
jgi:hypothetical protein